MSPQEVPRKGAAARGAALLLMAFAGVATAGCVDSPDDVFERVAVPVLQSRCASSTCHGVDEGTPWPTVEGLFFRLDRDGAIADVAAAREVARARIVTVEPAGLSTLVRIPMPRWADGGPHVGGALFSGPEDPAAVALTQWVDSEADGSGGEDLELTEREQLFADTVLPVLANRCGFAGCHGPTDVAFTAFRGRPDRETGAFAPQDVRAAYRTARKHLDLWGADPLSSRLLRKPLGPLAGGLVHRGGDGTFFSDAPLDRPTDSDDFQAMVTWARAERDALGVVDGQVPSALLFVRGPVAARTPYRIEAGPSGSDVYLAAYPPVPGDEDNLTAALHPEGPAELRDPAISHDGARVVFAMRRGSETRFSLWEIDLRTRESRRVSPETDPGSFVQPNWAADGRVVAAWDGHGEVGADGEGVPTEIVAIDRDQSLERLTWTPSPEMSPAMLAAGKTRGELVFGTRRRGEAGDEGVLFRFPLCHDGRFHGEPEYHVQFGASTAPIALLVARDLPDGRQVLIGLDNTDVADDRGRLGVLDRSLGPIVPEDAVDEVSMGGYRPAVTWLDTNARWRDPAVLPDGTVLAVADSPEAPGEDALYLVTLAGGVGGASLGSAELLLAARGETIRSPAPVFVRPPEDDGHEEVTDPTFDRGYLVLRDVAVLETLYGRVGPRGVRTLLEEIRGVRLLAWEGPPAADFGFYDDGGTTVGLTSRPPARVLAEHTLPGDRSAWLEVPARTPILLQWLDDRGMVVGNQLDRWFFAEGAESVPGGTNADTYAHNCTGCHGSMSGRPEDAFGLEPDAISAASVTMATYRNRDRRLPLPPSTMPMVGAAVDYDGSIAPLFEATCTASACHGGDAPAAGLPLDGRAGRGRFSAAYEQLMARFIDRDGLRARRSVLVERLVGEELEAEAPILGMCPPGGADDSLVRTVAQWIESGAFYDASAREEP